MVDDTDKPVEKPSESPKAAKGTAKPAGRAGASKTASSATSAPAKKPRATLAKGRTAAGRPAGSAVGRKTVAKPTPVAGKNGRKAKSAKMKAAKLVRDSFTMPKAEYAVITTLKERCLKVGVFAKKSQILRAAVTALAKLSDVALAAAIQRLEVIKTGRPKKSQ